MKLRAEDLVKKYKSRTVVKGVSVNVEQGEIVGLLGPNGAGKTTSFYMIVGLIKPNGGRIFLDDTEITTEPVYRRAQLGVGYLAQEASVFRQLSVEDNIKAVLEMSNLPKDYQRHRLEEMLDEFGLQHIRKSKMCIRDRNSITQLVVVDKDRHYKGMVHIHDILREGVV